MTSSPNSDVRPGEGNQMACYLPCILAMRLFGVGGPEVRNGRVGKTARKARNGFDLTLATLGRRYLSWSPI
jgi:hypothetical protein